jgi:hypothetical protein
MDSTHDSQFHQPFAAAGPPLLPASFVLSPAANVGRVEISRRKYTSRDNPRDVNVNFFLFPFPPKNIFFLLFIERQKPKEEQLKGSDDDVAKRSMRLACDNVDQHQQTLYFLILYSCVFFKLWRPLLLFVC